MRVKSRGAAFEFEGLMIPGAQSEEYVEVPKEIEAALLRRCRQSTAGSILMIAPVEKKAKSAPKAEKKKSVEKKATEG